MIKGRLILLLTVSFALISCTSEQSTFAGLGPQAVNIINLWWILFAISSIVLITVSFFLTKASLRKSTAPAVDDQTLGRGLVIGLVGTISLLLVIIFSTLTLGQALSDEEDGPVEIEITAKMWWWQVKYFDESGKYLFETANEIHVPVNRAMKLRLLSDNVIHSFWVPALAGKVDMIPGRVNHLTIKALKEGTFRGQCAEFCGVQHALMAFHVVAESEDKYKQWIHAHTQRPLAIKSKKFKRGRKAFFSYDCIRCHSIDGLKEAQVSKFSGPNLTHFGSRKYFAAGTYPNTKGHLSGWLLDPQGLKPGNYMPATAISAEDFEAILAFLKELK
ncbi:MAG: cytochrome c oxidase subunit II [Bacteriovoracaceae bacterium]|nr:cytochrome c oxidase subunit II [Bacteriovoracaceae bacterium]